MRVRPRQIRFAFCLALLVCGLIPAAASAAVVTVSGTALRDETGRVWEGCDVTQTNIAIDSNASPKQNVSCNPITGAFSFSFPVTATDNEIVVWFDGALGGSKGAVYTLSADATSNITGLQLIQDRIWVRSESATPISGGIIDNFNSSHDADIPLAAGPDVDDGFELHIGPGERFEADGGSYWNIDAEGTLAGSATVRAAGDSTDCTVGPGVERPLCIRPGGSFDKGSWSVLTYATEQPGPVMVDQLDAIQLDIYTAVAAGTTYTLGSGTSQTIQANMVNIGTWWTTAPVRLDVARFGPALDFGSFSLGTNHMLTGSPTTTNQLTIRRSLGGAGQILLPNTNLRFDMETGYGEMDSNWSSSNASWTFRDMIVASNYYRHQFGDASGLTANFNGGNADVATDIDSDGNYTWIGGTADNGGGQGDWVIAGYNYWSSGAEQFRNTIARAGDDRLMAINAGYDRVWAGGSVSTNAGDWEIRKYQPDGTLDTGFDTDGIWTWDSTGGFDEVRAIVNNYDAGVNMYAGGVRTTAGQGLNWEIKRFGGESSGSILATEWNSGGANNDEIHGACDNVDLGFYFVGQQGTNGGDWAVKRILNDGTVNFDAGFVGGTWTPYEDAPPAQQDAGLDVARDCIVSDGVLYVAGQGSANGGDLVVRAYDAATGNLLDGSGGRRAWGPSGTGIFTWDNGGAEIGYDVAATGYTLTVVGRSSAGAGTAVALRLNGDGILDTSFGTSGVLSWDISGAVEDAARGVVYDPNGDLRLAMTHGTNQGDIRIRSISYMGTALGNSNIAGARLVPGQGSSGRFHIEGDLYVGDNADGVLTDLDLDSENPVFDIDGTVNVRYSSAGNQGRLINSTTAPFTIGNDLTVNGTLVTRGGTLTFDDGSYRAIISLRVPTTIDGLTVTGTNKQLAFDETDLLTINGTLTAIGASCASAVRLQSNTPADQADIATVGATNISYAYVKDLNDTSPTTNVTNYTDGGNNTGFSWTTACGAGLSPGPNGMYVDNTNAQAGSYHNKAITSHTPHFSFLHRGGGTMDRQRLQVWNTMLDSSVVALWPLDNTDGLPNTEPDRSTNGTLLNLATAPARPTFAARSNFGSAAVYDGTDDTASTTAQAYFDLDTYTIDAWVNTTLAGPDNYPVLVQKYSSATNQNFRLYVSRPDGELRGEFSASGTTYVADAPSTLIGDGQWHHVAFTVDSTAGATKLAQLFVDGRKVGDVTFNGNVDNPNVGVTVGYALAGSLDDVRISNIARTPGEIMGYYKTALPHATTIWDSSPSDAGANLTVNCTGNRCEDFVYGGAPGTLVQEGARYYVTAKLRNTSGTWTEWNDPDWFETRGATTVSAAATSYFPALIPGSDTAISVPITVNTTNRTGYSLTLTGKSDTAGMSSGEYVIPPWTGTPATPSTWNAGTAGYFGVTVLSATGGKDTARWGTGATRTDYANLKYTGPLRSTSTLLHQRTTYTATDDTVDLSFRVNPQPAAKPGVYTTVVNVAALPNF